MGILQQYMYVDFERRTYYPFGMLMLGRVYNSAGYRYGSNSQEKDDEIYGIGNLYSAKYWEFDCRIARRWNLDPEFISSQTKYLAFGNNPISNVDPLGDVDFRDQSGNYLGNDGHSGDGKIYIITDKKIEKLVRSNDLNGGITSVEKLNDRYFALPPYEQRQEIKATVMSTPKNISYEIGGIGVIAEDGTEEHFLAAKGKDSSPGDENASVETQTRDKAENDRLIQFAIDHCRKVNPDYGYSISYDWHMHPDITWELHNDKWLDPREVTLKKSGETGTNAYGREPKTTSFGQEPSFFKDKQRTLPGDILNARNQEGRQHPVKDHFVISRVNGTVYYYNGQETERKPFSGSIPLSKFYDVKGGDHK